MVEMFRVLGDPVRWSVVSELARGTRCACELGDASGAAPSLLSHHLGALRDSGLVTAQRRGRWIDYTLVETRLEQLAAVLFDVASVENASNGPSAAILPSGKSEVA